MSTSQIFIIISILVLAIVALFVFFLGKQNSENKLTPLASLAFGFILAGILFGEDRMIGYGLMGVGVILSIGDIINRIRNK